MALTDKQFEVINFIEQDYLLNGQIPTSARMEELGLVGKKAYLEWLNDPQFRRNLVARGVSLGENNKSGALTEEQLTAANVMLDLNDNRSRKKKLSDLKIPTQKWEAWLRDPVFQSYLRARAENLLGDNLHDSHLALVDRVRSGDIAAIKYFNEITGRYIQAGGNNIDLASLLMRIIEIIQRHVTDNDQVSAIADDLLTLASGVGIGISAGSTQRAIEVKASEI